jgi:hypothetical protein
MMFSAVHNSMRSNISIRSGLSSRSQGAGRLASFAALVALAFLLCAPASRAGTVSGTVRNGTTGQLAANVEVILIQLQGGMTPVATTKTDSAGHFSFDNAGLGQAPMLLRAVYKGVFYHEPVPPGKATADIDVFEPTSKPSAISVSARAIILQPSTGSLLVGEEYSIQNATHPPLAFYRDDGDFLFSIPADAQFHEASAAGASGMPVIQHAIDKGKGVSAIAFAFRPGDSDVRISYNIPYNDNHATFRVTSLYASGRVAIFAPPTVQVSAEGFAPAGSDQGFSVYLRENVPAGAAFNVSASGTAPPPPAASQSGGDAGGGDAGQSPADNTQNPSVNSRVETSGAEIPTASLTTFPARIDGIKWILVSGFASLFLVGFAYLWLRPAAPAVAAGAPLGPAAAAPAANSAATSKASVLRAAASSPPVAAPAAPAVAAADAALSEVDQAIQSTLATLKEALFRLELRRQSGGLAEEEYARERSRLEKVLRDLVRP